MQKEIGLGRRGRAWRVLGQRVPGQHAFAQTRSASAVLVLAAALAACGDDPNPAEMPRPENQTPAPGPSAMPGVMTPPNTAPSDGENATPPVDPAPGPNEAASNGMIPLEPGAMEGEAGGSSDTPPAEEPPPAEEDPPAEEPPPEPAAFNPCPTDGSACRIMPLGDSITDGLVGNGPGNTTGSVGGYRVELFRQAVADGHAITFVGRQQNGPNDVDGEAFPRNHEGYSGITIPRLSNEEVDDALAANDPHIILLHIGTNDNTFGDAAGAPGNLGNLLDQITEAEPNALVVVAQIIPLGFGGNAVTTYNAAIPGIVQERAAAGKHLIVVDQFTPIASTPNFVAELVGDSIHPNADGYAVMAQTWYEAVESFLP